VKVVIIKMQNTSTALTRHVVKLIGVKSGNKTQFNVTHATRSCNDDTHKRL